MKGRCNLYTEELTEQCISTCIEVPSIAAHKQMLDALVGRRNEIAHGRKIVIDDFAKYQPYENAAVSVMHELAYAIIAALTERRFLQPVPEYVL